MHMSMCVRVCVNTHKIMENSRKYNIFIQSGQKGIGQLTKASSTNMLWLFSKINSS